MAGAQDSSEIQEFFRDTNVFITGGSGFLGKLIIEKLLRACPGIKRIYILYRPKKGKGVLERLAEQFDGHLYDVLRRTDPEFKSKIVSIQGDCTLMNLGIGDDDRKTLVKEIDVIFHCAATVRFDEPLRTAVRINIRGTRELLLLARGMKHLKSLVHVSTAYSNCVRHHIEEKLYEPPFDGDLLMALVETADEDTLSRITPGLLGEYPNTYTYTKAVAEDIVKRYSGGFPVCIIRPSIILSTSKDPFAGWCDNLYGATGAVRALFLGLLHTWHGDPNNIAAIVPGDYVTNATIAAAWHIAQTLKTPLANGIARSHQLGPPSRNSGMNSSTQLESNDGIVIYNYTGSRKRVLTWGTEAVPAPQLLQPSSYCREALVTYLVLRNLLRRKTPTEFYELGEFVKGALKNNRLMPTLGSSLPCFVIMTKHKYVDMLYRYLFHYLPAYVADFLLFASGKPTKQVKNYNRMHKVMKLILYFTLREWKFGNENVQNLYAKLNGTDRELFDLDMDAFSWSEYMASYVAGIRMYIFGDPLTTLPRARTKHMMIRALSKMSLAVSMYFMFCVLF